ncbi:TetR family transcriptional regulator [Prauserella shujinwangii]|uniref:TetR family transcriptional regulator n=1 Tax=Prauserella shujinwangii TaxID=1453103 RepID=A0A2T0LX12_9PSEU|nr:TetR family transcriptional regulator [Prauserella shujinwangii]PRX48562.1 TetR family transcriptional regulator [Prauserella shujinwangii]
MTAGTVADTRSRLLATALKLFREHGVEGTSLQMIADELGVTKAAVYYHFHTKDEIAEAVAAPALRELLEITEAAAAHRRQGARVDHALAGFVDLVVRHRALLALCNSDPGLVRAIDRTLNGLDDFKVRLLDVLAGPDPDLELMISVHVALAGIALAGGSPDLADVDDETLREHLTGIGRRLLRRPRRRA